MEALFIPIAVMVLGIAAVVFATTRPGLTQRRVATAPPTLNPLRHVDIFRGLSDRELTMVAALGRKFRVEAGRILGAQGETGTHLYAILEGQAQLTAHSPLGEATVRVAGPRESMPLAALIGSGRLITTVEAMTDMTVLAIPRSGLVDLVSRNTNIGMNLYAAVAEVLAHRYERTLAHLTTSVGVALRESGVFANV